MTRAGGPDELPMTLGYFRLILRTFGDTPARRAAILDGTGVKERQLASHASEITLFQQLRQFDNVERLCGPGWPFLRPDIWRVMSHGPLGIATASSTTVADAIEVLRRFGPVRAPYYRLHVAKRGEIVTLLREATVPLTGSQERALTEASNLALHELLTTVLGFQPEKAVFLFTNPRPSYVDKIERELGRNLRFGEKRNGTHIPVSWLKLRPPTADAVLYRSAVEQLERAQERLERPRDLRARVLRLLHTMPDGKMSASGAAGALGVSNRTLVRRLAEVGASYRDLHDEEMKRRAASLLRSGTLQRDAMAERLGYRDPTSFSRACRRWFGERKGVTHRRRSAMR
jgi:AraC-like DNA-binding protein